MNKDIEMKDIIFANIEYYCKRQRSTVLTLIYW